MDKRTKLAIDLGQTIYNNTIAHLQDKLDKQAAEIAALRDFALVMTEPYTDTPISNTVKYYAINYGLIDENGNPTPLLTGESE